MQLIFLGPYILPSPKHHQATQTGNVKEFSLSIYLEIEDRGYNVAAFCAGARLDRGAKERTHGPL